MLLIAVLSCGRAARADADAIPNGFTRLFNGRSLDGWHISRVNHHGTTPNWYVESGVLIGKQNPIGEGGILLTNKRYKNFELYLEIDPDWGCDGGVFLRSTEGGSGYQINIRVDKAYRGGPGVGGLIGEKVRVSQGASAAWEKVWRRGTWNSLRIRMTGDVPQISVWINDALMFDVVQKTNDLIGDATTGMIALQVHWSEGRMPSWRPGKAHRFRNIAIREMR